MLGRFLVLLGLMLAIFMLGCADESVAPEATTGSLNGAVIDVQTGDPVSGARVFLITDEVAVLKVVDSDPDGQFTFAGLPAGGFLLYALDEHFTLVESHDARVQVQTGQTISANLQMRPFSETDLYTFRITGRITDSASGEPVQGAWIMNNGYGEMGNSVRYLMDNSGLIVTVTDQDGQYSLPAWPILDYYPDGQVIGLAPVACAASGYRPRTFVGSGPSFAHEEWFQGGLLPAPADSILVLDIALVSIPEDGLPANEVGTVRGRILNQGLPQAGVMVTTTLTTLAEPDTIYAENKVAVPGGSMTSLADGTFELNLEPGHYAFRAGLLPDDGWCRSGGPGMFEIVAGQTLELGDIGVWPAVIPVSPARAEIVVYPLNMFAWSSVPEAERYEIEVYSENVNYYLATATTDTFYVLEGNSIPPSGAGDFSWRVKALKQVDGPDYSPIAWFEVVSDFTVVSE